MVKRDAALVGEEHVDVAPEIVGRGQALGERPWRGAAGERHHPGADLEELGDRRAGNVVGHHELGHRATLSPTLGLVTVEIRRLRPGEERQAGDVTALAYRNQAEPASSNPDYLDRVADVAARAQHAMIPGGHPRPPLETDRAHVRMLGVHPDVQGRGIGRRLMEGAAEEARRAGKRRVTLETTETMRAAQHLYESMGYRRGEDLEFDDGFQLRTYVLRL